VAYQKRLFWDGGGLTLESQVLGPLQDPNEMDLPLDSAVARLAARPAYVRDFESVFDEGPSIQTLTQALASYMRTIRSGGSKFDRMQAGDSRALTGQEATGYAVFESRCATCHSGPLLTSLAYESNGLAVNPADSGRARITGQPSDYGRFKVPSLRNVAITAPYMHDGRMGTLEAVVSHYSRSKATVRNRSSLVDSLDLSAHDQEALIAFLHTLTDDEVKVGFTE